MDEHELRRLMFTAQLPNKGTFVIRYPRGQGQLVDWKCPLEEVEVGIGRRMREGKSVAVLSIGPIGTSVEQAIDESNLDIAHYDMRFLKPLDNKLLQEVGEQFKTIITVEDGSRDGGMGSAVLEWMADHDYTPRVIRLGIADNFVEHGTVEQLYEACGISKEAIKKVIYQIANEA